MYAPYFLIDHDFEDGTKRLSQIELGNYPTPKGRKRIVRIISTGDNWIIMYTTDCNPVISETVIFNPEQNVSHLISKITFDKGHHQFNNGIPFDFAVPSP